MTIINRSHMFIFIHVPKTAGTSVKTHLKRFQTAGDLCLERYAGAHESLGKGDPAECNLRKHSRALEVCAEIGRAEFMRFFRFSCVRNPFDRARSIFDFLKFKFRSWPRSGIMDRFDTLEQFVTSQFFWQSGPGRIFEPQTWWLVSGDGSLSVDFLARVEFLDRDIAWICRRLSLETPVAPIERKNISVPAKPEESATITPSAVDAIRRRYRSDFEAFGYPLEPPCQNWGRIE